MYFVVLVMLGILWQFVADAINQIVSFFIFRVFFSSFEETNKHNLIPLEKQNIEADLVNIQVKWNTREHITLFPGMKTFCTIIFFGEAFSVLSNLFYYNELEHFLQNAIRNKH